MSFESHEKAPPANDEERPKKKEPPIAFSRVEGVTGEIIIITPKRRQKKNGLLIELSLPRPFVPRVSRDEMRRWAGWNFVAEDRNPFFVDGSALAGYFVGRAGSAEDALVQLLAIGRSVLDSQARMYRHNSRFLRSLAGPLYGDSIVNLDVLREWDVQLRMTMAMQRAAISANPEATAFRRHTWQLMDAVNPELMLKPQETAVSWGYHINLSALPMDHERGRMLVDLERLRTTEQEAWRVVMLLHKMADPTIYHLLQQMGMR